MAHNPPAPVFYEFNKEGKSKEEGEALVNDICEKLQIDPFNFPARYAYKCLVVVMERGLFQEITILAQDGRLFSGGIEPDYSGSITTIIHAPKTKKSTHVELERVNATGFYFQAQEELDKMNDGMTTKDYIDYSKVLFEGWYRTRTTHLHLHSRDMIPS